MPQDPSGSSQAFTGPYGPNDPAANLAHAMVTHAGDVPSKEDKALDEKINKFNVKTDETVVNALKGKSSSPSKPHTPKPPEMAYMKTSDYARVREARKKL
jgi:hypothetical protein